MRQFVIDSLNILRLTADMFTNAHTFTVNMYTTAHMYTSMGGGGRSHAWLRVAVYIY